LGDTSVYRTLSGVLSANPRLLREALIPTKVDSMSDLYARLAATGFDRDFLKTAILPEWWEDSLAEVPANRAFAENLVARSLGMPISDLSRPSANLKLPSLNHVKFKRYKNNVDERVAPAILVAQYAAKIVVDAVSLPPFALNFDAAAVRQAILRHSRYVDLPSLLEFCWTSGILVLHLAQAPKKSKLFDGLAMFCGDRPVLVLGTRRDSPAWLAFYLAHEISHIIRRHVTPGSPPLADSDLQSSSTDRQEKEADAAACELLTGVACPNIRDLKYNALQLALMVNREGPSIGVDPGVMALIYGKSNDRWGPAQNALKHLSLSSGAHEMIAEALRKRFNPENLPESSERFISVLSI
jgi:hypothetical protein